MKKCEERLANWLGAFLMPKSGIGEDMNEKNLKPFNKLTESEQREIAKKGGLASAKAKKHRKQLKDALMFYAGIKLPDSEAKRQGKYYKKGMTINDKMAATIIKMALAGRISAIRIYMEIMGEGKTLELKERLVDDKTW